MNRGFFPKLAADNIRKNGKVYFPYIVTCVVTVAIFYIVKSLSLNPGLERMMQQKPTGRRVPEPPALPPDHPCYGCNYGMGRRCVGVCYKELLMISRNPE